MTIETFKSASGDGASRNPDADLEEYFCCTAWTMGLSAAGVLWVCYLGASECDGHHFYFFFTFPFFEATDVSGMNLDDTLLLINRSRDNKDTL